MHPTDPVNAVMHTNPYPYYAGLVAGAPLVFDERLRLWIASSAATVTEVMRNQHCKVRPSVEPVQKVIAGAPAGEIFGALVRMNDGDRHTQPKLALQRALAAVDLSSLAARAQDAAMLLASQCLQRQDDVAALTAWMHEVPIYTMASLLGFNNRALPQVAVWIGKFVACLSPLSTAEQIAASNEVAQQLLDGFKELVRNVQPARDSLLAQVMQEADAVGWDNAHALLANLVGLLSQTYEATAGLIGNSIVALATQPGLEQAMRADPSLLTPMVQEVSRFDPSVQNTRRFVVQTTMIAGVTLEAGQAILLVLAAASRDPDANPQSHDFLLQRAERRVFGFGHGVHACPGQALAYTIAAAALGELLRVRSASFAGALSWSYRSSVNGRIPLFINATKEPT